MYRLIGLMITLLWSASSFAANVSAQVDRSELSEADSFRLTVRVDSTSFSMQPDFEPLNENFVVLGTSRSSEMRSINGVTETSMEWIVTLSPKGIGTFNIPPIVIGQDATQPIPVTVKALSPDDLSQIKQSVFFQTQVDKTSVYVQEQFIYTVQLYYADTVQLYGVFPPEPSIDNAIVKAIGGSTPFQTIKNNIRYGAIERKYLVFPQASGPLTIPGESISGNIQERKSGNFSSFTRKGIKVNSDPISITVKPKPTSFPADVPWLPADSLTISEVWSSNPPKFTVGEPMNRTISLRASGIDGALLPEFAPLNVDGLKIYPDPAKTDESINSRGLLSARIETMALVPTKAGPLTLPERRIIWWNVKTDQLQETLLAQQKYNVLPNPEQPIAEQTAYQAPSNNATSDSSINPSPASTTANPVTTKPSWLFIALVGLLALGWASTLHLYYQLKRSQTTQKEPPLKTRRVNQKEIAAALKHLTTCCGENDAVRAKFALLELAKYLYPNQTPMTLETVIKVSKNSALKQAIRLLEQSLYSRSGNPYHWQEGATLAAAVHAWLAEHQDQHKKRHPSEALPPLYPIQ